MQLSLVGDYAVIVHTEARPTDDAWNGWLDTYRMRMTELRGVLIYSLGGGPDAEQRRRLLDLLERSEQVPPTAIVTPSRLMRVLVTALNWFLSPKAQGAIFAPTELERALDHLRVPASGREPLRAALAQTQETLERRKAPAERR